MARPSSLTDRIMDVLAKGFASRRDLCVQFCVTVARVEEAMRQPIEDGVVVVDTVQSEHRENRDVVVYRLATSLKGSQGGEIPCLCCRRPFRSIDVKRNRICYACRIQSRDVSPYAP